MRLATGARLRLDTGARLRLDTGLRLATRCFLTGVAQLAAVVGGFAAAVVVFVAALVALTTGSRFAVTFFATLFAPPHGRGLTAGERGFPMN